MKPSLLLLLACCIVGCTKLPFTDRFEPAPLHERRAGLYAQDFRRQRSLFTQATVLLEEQPTSAAPYAQFARIYMAEARVTGEHPYYYPLALNALDHGLHVQPHNAELEMLRTSVLLSLHHFAEAKELATELLARVPNTAVVYGMLVDAHVELGELDQAIAAADQMMRLRPGLEAYARVSHLREIHGDTLGAIHAMKMAVQSGLPGTDDAAWTRTTFGTLLANAGRIQEAKVQFELARLERPNYPFALAGLARLQFAAHDLSGAKALLDSAIMLIPEVSFYDDLAAIAHEEGNKAEEVRILHMIETMLDEDEQAGHRNDAERAMIYARHMYKLDEAYTRARREMSIRPKNRTAQQALAFVQQRMREHDGASL